jgi:hypothetical protein
MKDIRNIHSNASFKIKDSEYTYTNDYKYLKKQGVLQDEDLTIHFEKASIKDRLASSIIGRLFGYATDLIHNYRLHLIEQLANRYVASKPESEQLYRRVVSHFYHAFIIFNSIKSKINRFDILNEKDISILNEYVDDHIKISMPEQGKTIINISIDLLKLSEYDKIKFQNSKIFYDLMKLSAQEEITIDDVSRVFSKFQEAEFIANHNIFSIAEFLQTNNIPIPIQHQLKEVFQPYTVIDSIIDNNAFEELSESEIIQKYNLLMINNAINEYKLSHPMLYPNYMSKNYFSQNSNPTIEEAFHPHLDWKIFHGYKIITQQEINGLKNNEILISGIEDKLATLQKLYQSTWEERLN